MFCRIPPTSSASPKPPFLPTEPTALCTQSDAWPHATALLPILNPSPQCITASPRASRRGASFVYAQLLKRAGVQLMHWVTSVSVSRDGWIEKDLLWLPSVPQCPTRGPEIPGDWCCCRGQGLLLSPFKHFIPTQHQLDIPHLKTPRIKATVMLKKITISLETCPRTDLFLSKDQGKEMKLGKEKKEKAS